MPIQGSSRKPSDGPLDTTPEAVTNGVRSSLSAARPAPPTSTTEDRRARTPVARTRAGAAWIGIVVAVAVLVLLIVFVLQNTEPVEVAFFGLRGTAPLSATLLIAGVGFAVVTLIIGSLRIGQLRRRIGSGHDRVRHIADERH